MQTQRAARGRPPKAAERRKTDYLDIRLETSEKQAFRDAADVAGLDLSAWVRERLRASARKELESVGKSPAFLTRPESIETMTPRADHVAAARYVAPGRLFIEFTDGFKGTWAFKKLELDTSNLNLGTLQPAASRTSIEARTKKGRRLQLDASWLRALVDPAYRAELEQALLTLRGPLDALTP